MRVAYFCHSLVSDWNHGNAHFLRGIISELLRQGHSVQVYEPEDGWSYRNLVDNHGPAAAFAYSSTYPTLSSTRYSDSTLDLDRALDRVDLVIVHEWTDPEIVTQIGSHHRRHPAYTLLFHDTHHRAASAPDDMSRLDLEGYNAVVAFGNVIRDSYLDRGWTSKAFTWHEAADTTVFYPRRDTAREGDVVWIGNWGDDERTGELREFLIQPVVALGLKAVIYGVRYPEQALAELDHAGIEYRGWLPNHRVPDIFARFAVTLHVPRRPYAAALPGVPTIRMFEALACGIPLVSAPWSDAEHLFEPGSDYLVARDGFEMRRHLSEVLNNPEYGEKIAAHGLNTIRARHTCRHRVSELLSIVEALQSSACAAGVNRS